MRIARSTCWTVKQEVRLRIGDALQALRERAGSEGFPSLSDALYEELWKRIVNLEFAPGSRLSDDMIANELGVSRTPVREALLRLSQTGLVRINSRRGFFVPVVTRQDASEIYDLRIALESFAARIATPLLSDDDLAPHLERQERVLARATSLAPADAEDFVQSDFLLHDLLLQRAGNHRMRQILADLKGQLSIVHLRIAQVPDWRLAAVEEHGRILDALVARDAEASAKAMEDHLQGVKMRVLKDFDLPSHPGRT